MSTDVDVRLISLKLRELLKEYQYHLGPVYTEDKSLSLEHLTSMLDALDKCDPDEHKWHRWLGWVQCALVARDVCSLKEMMDLNRACKL